MDKRRPVSFSEGHIPASAFEPLTQHAIIPRIGSLETGLCTLDRSPPSSPPRNSHQRSPTTKVIDTIHRNAIRFTMHLALIALFETVFFWHIVAPSEDSALINLIQSYTSGMVSTIQSANPMNRTAFMEFFDIVVNVSQVDVQGSQAATTRNAFNAILQRNSWLYMGGLSAATAVLSAAAPLRRLPIKWSHIVGENVALIVLLGLYEYMFFRTIVFKYRATSMEELDAMVVDQIQTAGS